MRKPKKNTGNKNENQKPVESNDKNKSMGQSVSGHPESQGGSRQGNIGHEHTDESGRGDRQV
jgi:hypothetical protein